LIFFFYFFLFFFIFFFLYKVCFLKRMRMKRDYSRFELAFGGAERFQRLKGATVLVQGLNGTGVEVVKNLALSGVDKIMVDDDAKICEEDLATSFCFSPEDIGRVRSDVVMAKLSLLNEECRIVKLVDGIHPTIVVLCNLPIGSESLEKASSHWRQLGCSVVAVDVSGLLMSLFVDCGPDGTVFWLQSALENAMRIARVETGNELFVADFGHNLNAPCRVLLRSADQKKEASVLVSPTSSTKLKIVADAALVAEGLDCFSGGSIHPEEEQVTVAHRSLREEKACLTGIGRRDLKSRQMWSVFKWLGSYFDEHGRVFWCADEDVPEGTIAGLTEEERNLVLAGQGRFGCAPLTSVAGGLASQEVMKLLTRYHFPLSQWLFFSADALLRYACGGEGQTELLEQRRVFVVGAGAIGCELLKNLALLGVGCGLRGCVTVADADEISNSNLHRQFLFRKEDMGLSKSATAARRCKGMNSRMNVTSKHTELNWDSCRTTFDDEFWSGMDDVFGAVDNVKARKFLDQQIHFYRCAFFDSGTKGPHASTQVVVPGFTQPYAGEEAHDEVIASCTGKMFPFRQTHCMEWALNKGFEPLFGPKSVGVAKRVVEDVFLELFVELPEQMLESHPIEQVSGEGVSFWTGERLAPSPLVWCADDHLCAQLRSGMQRVYEGWQGDRPLYFDKDDDGHVEFVESVCNLFCRVFGLPMLSNRLKARQMAGRIIPATISSTAIAAGLSCLSFLVLLDRGYASLKAVREYRLDGIRNLLMSSAPVVSSSTRIPVTTLIEIAVPRTGTVGQLVEILHKKYFLRPISLTVPLLGLGLSLTQDSMLILNKERFRSSFEKLKFLLVEATGTGSQSTFSIKLIFI
jgi:molybdopterin/thiamine biosynthesis adenylyltransferase